ncbi:hypothetical protein AB3M83_12565 [Microbacterium sp. 179-B 1A2 NHS]|uniref:hypothetical protein n=1 Tax=Microbacterium sp. 179-B 1A2 NHS TaxID=3142383 RepID=UPI00399FE348
MTEPSEERMPSPAAPADPSEPATSAEPTTPAAPAGPSPRPGAAADDAVPATSIEPPSPDVARVPSTPVLPGEHRGGFRRELTQPLPIAPPLEVHPEPGLVTGELLNPDPQVHWIHPPPTLPHSAGWSLLAGVLGLILSFFVGWGFPIGLLGAVLAILAIRRPWENREMAVWALTLNLASLVYSAGWLWWASTQGPLFG